MRTGRDWRKFDFILLGVVLALCAFGVAVIRSANLDTPDLADLWRRQTTFGIIGLGLFFAIAVIPYEWLRHFWWVGYLIELGLLVLVLFVGKSELGDVRRWFFIGNFRLQPSFVAFLFQIVALAVVLDYEPTKGDRLAGVGDEERERPRGRFFLLSGLLALVPAVLVFREPDMSTAFVFLAIWAMMAFVSEVRVGYLLGTTVLAVGALFPLWQAMQPYQRERVLNFLNPSRDPDALYNVQQALISIGSGALWGKGYGEGSLNRLHFLRVRHTDFIFSVVGEELGFIGTVLLLVLFALLAWRVFRAALLAPDRFGRLLVVGVAAAIFSQVVVNIAMNLGLLPVTGVPLPFVSYGGSALVTLLTGLGLVEAVAMRHK
ncbi:MAG: FtsW/RodA/SpoVE family cell cycle protein [Anaerolineae bacterium]|jgi:rod shape determining protein RodA